jgi:hypothetical protein
LEPRSGSYDEKFFLNCLACGEFEPVVSLRISRINHACLSNAAHFYEEQTKTKVLHSSKPIKGSTIPLIQSSLSSLLFSSIRNFVV